MIEYCNRVPGAPLEKFFGILVTTLCVVTITFGALIGFAYARTVSEANARHQASCVRAFADGWLPDTAPGRAACDNLLLVGFEPCRADTRPYYCNLQRDYVLHKHPLVTLYKTDRGNDGELVEVGLRPEYEITFY